MARSESVISAIFASWAFSSSALVVAAFSSLARSFIASRSSAENFLPVVLVLVDLVFCVSAIFGFLAA